MQYFKFIQCVCPWLLEGLPMNIFGGTSGKQLLSVGDSFKNAKGEVVPSDKVISVTLHPGLHETTPVVWIESPKNIRPLTGNQKRVFYPLDEDIAGYLDTLSYA